MTVIEGGEVFTANKPPKFIRNYITLLDRCNKLETVTEKNKQITIILKEKDYEGSNGNKNV